MKKNYLFTSESVSEGHPDKVCDRISDMVVDTYLDAEPHSRVACETLTTTNKVVLAGEVRGPEIKKDDLIEKVRNCIKDIGYDQDGFTYKEATKIESHLHAQSSDIAMGVDSSGNKDEGAGDQGIMFGYACNETDVLMPAPIHYSHKILRLMAEDRKSGKLKNIEPDSKSQITIEYRDGIPAAVKSVVISTQHSADVDQKKVRDLVKPYIEKSIPKNLHCNLMALKQMVSSKDILMGTTSRILKYWEISNYVSYEVQNLEDKVIIKIHEDMHCPIGVKSIESFHLSGLTFYINILKPYKIIFKNKLCKTIVNPPDETGQKSVSIPWEKLEYPKVNIL